MSASTGTIRRTMGGGSIFGAVAVGAVTLIAALGLAWGALNLTGTRHVATPVPAPTYLDRDYFGSPQMAPQSQSQPITRFVGGSADNLVGGGVVSKPGNETPRKTHSTHARHGGPSL
jgi:hypothetical protein